MKIEILDDDLKKRVLDVNELEEETNDLVYVDSSSKEESAINILKAYKSDKKQILYDVDNESIKEVLKKQNFEKHDFSMLLFTSGTTGRPVGAFKSKENLDNEVDELIKLVSKYKPKRVLSTVPFVHIYGILTSIILPYKLNIDLVFKKHFLPHHLLDLIEPYTIVVTTPLYIKALLRVKTTRDLKNVLFISSTAPLDAQSAKDFIKKFNTNLIQLFGSTETGGIAYKEQNDELWNLIDGVKADVNSENLLKITSPFVSKFLYEGSLKNTHGSIQSFDYVEFFGNKFKMIGRNSDIFKVSGKRFSSLHVENILESMKSVRKAFVDVKYNKGELKDECLDIYLESSEHITLKEVNDALKEKMGNIKFPIKLKVVDEIETTSLGKKIIPI